VIWSFIETGNRKQETGNRKQGSGVGGLGTEDFYEEQTGADDDAAVGDVEVGPVVVDDVDFEEVDDVGETEAVVEIADRSTEDEGECDSCEGQGSAYAPEHGKNDDDSEDGERDEAIADHDGRKRVEEREGRAGIENVGKAEDAGDDGDGVAGIDVVDDPDFAALVGNDDEGGEQKEGDSAVPFVVWCEGHLGLRLH
jgi:hypothetical protein